MRLTVMLGLLTLTLTTAQAYAQTSDNPPAVTPPTEEQPKVPDSLKDFVVSGAIISFLDTAGNVVATVNSDGTIKVNEGADLKTAKSIRVEQQANSTTYELATKIQDEKDGKMIFVTQINPEGKTLTLPLVAALQKREERAVEKKQLKEEKIQEKAEKAEAREQEKAEKAEAREQEKAEKAEAREQEKAEKAEAREQEKADKVVEKESKPEHEKMERPEKTNSGRGKGHND